MLYSALISVMALLPALASAKPIEKRLTGQVIQSYRTGNCLSLYPGSAPSNGAPLTTVPCATASRWDISPGSGSVILSGTNFALDAGVPQQNFNYGKVWQSYPGSTQQTWYLTADNRIAVTGGTQCLDQGDNGPQTYTCTTGNNNQVWLVQNPPAAGSTTMPPSTTTTRASTTTMASTTTTSRSSSSTTTTSAPATTSSSGVTTNLLKWNGGNLCATVQGGTAGNGVLINAQTCTSGQANQQFQFMGNGLIQYQTSGYCIDAGSNPANGIQMKLWQCYPGLSQQTWNHGTSGLFQTANNECLDLDNSNYSKIQTWACSSPDPQQQWTITS